MDWEGALDSHQLCFALEPDPDALGRFRGLLWLL